MTANAAHVDRRDHFPINPLDPLASPGRIQRTRAEPLYGLAGDVR